MNRILTALALSVFSFGAGAASSPPPISALLKQESTQHRADGVTQTFVYQEKFLRVGDTAWLERVLPGGQPLKPKQPSPGDDGPNLQILPRWMRAADDGKASLTLVDREEHFVVAIKPPEFGRLGFGGNWLTERSLIDPADLKAMKPMDRRSPSTGARWLEARADSRYSRVLWNEHLQFPLAIETGTEDGRDTSVTTITLQPIPTTLPWAGLETYRVREVDDFGD